MKTSFILSFLAVGAVLSGQVASAQVAPSFDVTVLDGQNHRTLGDRGRWVRWPDQERRPFLRLAFFETDPNGDVSLWMALSEEEKFSYGPAGRQHRFKGKFAAGGFDLTLECVPAAGEQCLPMDYMHPRYRDAFEGSGLTLTYRYHLEVLAEDLLLITAYTPRIRFAGERLVGVEPEGIVRKIYLTRDDDCSRSLETVRTELVEGEFSDRLILALGSPKPLSRGSVIEENSIVPREVFTTDRAACFFYLDLVPNAGYAHPVLYVLTDRETAEVTRREWGMAPPIVTDPDRADGTATPYYETLEGRIGSPDRFFPTSQGDLSRPILRGPFDPSVPEAAGEVIARLWTGPGMRPRLTNSGYERPSRARFVRASFRTFGSAQQDKAAEDATCRVTRKVALLVDAGKEEAFRASVSRMSRMLDMYDFDAVETVSWQRHSVADVRKTIGDVTADLGECDVFLLYVVAHAVAHEDCATCDMGSYRTDGEIYYNSPFDKFAAHAWSVSNLERNVSRPLKIDTGPGLLYSLRGVEAGHIEVILDMCNSGLLIDAASSPRWGGPPISGYLSRRQSLSILTAARRDQTMDFALADDYSFWGYLARGDAWTAGGVFTQVLARKLEDEAEAADLDSDGRVDKAEFDRAARRAMRNAVDLFQGPIDGLLRGRSQDPQSYHVRGDVP